MAGFSGPVYVSSGFSNPDSRALSETERAAAGMLGFSEEQFRRIKSEYLQTEEQRRERGKALGGLAQEVMQELGQPYQIISVTWNGSTLSWRLEVGTPHGPRNVVLAWAFVDDVLDSRTATEIQRLRNMVLFGLGRRDLIFKERK
ncbi:MAG: hypothetical protein WBX38_10685 [Candidatus Sulfotelmatobacter sp.]